MVQVISCLHIPSCRTNDLVPFAFPFPHHQEKTMKSGLVLAVCLLMLAMWMRSSNATKVQSQSRVTNPEQEGYLTEDFSFVLSEGNRIHCSAVRVNTSWLLTAAHCVAG